MRAPIFCGCCRITDEGLSFVLFVGVSFQLPGMAVGERAIGLTSHMQAMGLLDSARVLFVYSSLPHSWAKLMVIQIVASQPFSRLPPRMADHRWHMARKTMDRDERRPPRRRTPSHRAVTDELGNVRDGAVREESAARCRCLRLRGHRVLYRRDGRHQDPNRRGVCPRSPLPRVLLPDRNSMHHGLRELFLTDGSKRE